MKSYRSFGIILTLVVAIVAVWYLQVDNEAPPSPDTAAQDAQTAPPPASQQAPAQQQPGMVVHIDPVTGEPLETPPPGTELEPVSKHSVEGLQPQPASGGGMMIDLQGRFQQSATVTLGDSDSVKIECGPEETKHDEAHESGADGGS